MQAEDRDTVVCSVDDSLVNKQALENALAIEISNTQEIEYIVGIDEAGRGPVLGPMIYAGACWPSKYSEILAKVGFKDSKKINTEEKREGFFRAIEELKNARLMDTHFVSLSAKLISQTMFDETTSSNLNTISHNTAISIVRHFLNKGYKITSAFVDTVGDADLYRQKFESAFKDISPPINFTVCSKADDLFPVASAASIVAKVNRDREIKYWVFPEGLTDRDFSCGYPSDSTTVKWLARNFEPLFGYPNIVRFSWKTISEGQFNKFKFEHDFKSDLNAVRQGKNNIARLMEFQTDKPYIGDFLEKINYIHDFDF